MSGAEGIYGDYGSTMRSFRSSASGLSTRQRPRQMMMQSPPPPPILEELVNKETAKEERKKKKKSKSRDYPDSGGEMMPPLINGSVNNLNGNGSVINGGRASSVIGGRKMSAGSFIGVNGNNGRSQRGPSVGPPGPYGPPPMGGPGYGPPPPMMMMPPRGKKGGTFSGRQKGMRGMPPPHMMFGPPHMMPPPHLIPPPGHPLHPHGPMVPGMMPGGRPESQVMEEPIYMPNSARPMSPVASYQPGHFPHDAYYNQQQYATIDKNGKYRQGQKNERSKQKSGKRSKQQSSAESNAEDSEGTGIYKKGYINERAFATSMRNEQRSRSYGSLANMEEYDPHGDPMMGSPDQIDAGDMETGRSKKTREMMHMMDNLDLDDDAIERSEVPANFYPPPRMYRGMPPGSGLPPPHPHMNGNGPTRRHKR